MSFMSLRLDYLAEGDDGGPLIRIFGRDEKAMGDFIAVIERLKLGSPAIKLGSEHGIAPVNCELSIGMSSRGPTSLRELKPKQSFLWTLNEGEHAHVLGLLEPFRRLDPHDAYQWLRDDASGLDAKGRCIRILVSASDNGTW
ncbi:MAG: hypothetical protein ACREEP_21745 [Dongiaceae bacterium]